MKAGFREAARIVAAARTLGMGLMIGGMVETRLAMGASACFVASHGGASAFEHIDLDTPLFLASDPFSGGYAQEGAILDLSPIEAGHGCVPVPG
jgi:L-alanine-DL-glutamate epimerase-like enolase superfamily enzyme